MANVAVTNTFVAGTSAVAAQVNTNFSDIVTWLNNRNAGSDTWGYLKVTATVANPIVITSSAATTEVSIDNTATDGDPLLTFKLSGSTGYSMGIDDSDADAFLFSTTALATNNAFRIPAVGAQVQFNAGTAALPGISFIGDPDTGIYRSSVNVLTIACGGSQIVDVSNGIINTFNNVLEIGDGTVGTPGIHFYNDSDTGIYRIGANQLGFSTGGQFRVGIYDDGTTRFTFPGSASVPTISYSSQNNTGIYFPSTASIGFTVNGNLRMYVQDSDATLNLAAHLWPVTTNTYGIGKSGKVWTDVWATNGTIQTSHSSTKVNIETVNVVDAAVPEAIYFSRPDEQSGLQQLGFLADNLPEECFAILPDGTRSATDVYTSSVIGILCAQVKSLLERIVILESK